MRASSSLFVAALVAAGAIAQQEVPTTQPAPQPSPEVRLTFNFVPGAQATYTLQIDGKRTTTRRSRTEIVHYKQSAKLTTCMTHDAPGAKSGMVQMLEVSEPEVVSVTRSGAALEKLPPAVSLGLGQKSVAMYAMEVFAGNIHFAVPGDSLQQKLGVFSVVDHLICPKTSISMGSHWTAGSTYGTFRMESQYEVIKLDSDGEKPTVQIRILAAGKDVAAVNEPFQLLGMQAEMAWDLNANLPQSIAGGSVSRKVTGTEQVNLECRVKLERTDYKRLAPPQLRAAKVNAGAVMEAAGKYVRREEDAAQALLKEFVYDHPKSTWRPAADYLLRQIAHNKAEREPAEFERVRKSLLKFAESWQKVRAGSERAQYVQFADEMRKFADTDAERLRILADGHDPNYRGLSTFALVFSSSPTDIEQVWQGGADEHPRVRAWVCWAMAANDKPDLNEELFLKFVCDPDESVRQRVGDVIVRRIKPDSSLARRVVALLCERLDDPSETVAAMAGRSLKRLAQGADLARLKAATSKAKSEFARQTLSEIVKSLESDRKDR